MPNDFANRRDFLRRSLALVAGVPLMSAAGWDRLRAAEPGGDTPLSVAARRPDAKVAVVPCRSYGAEVHTALARCCDLLGGLGALVNHKTVTVKINLTGTDFTPFLGRPVGETYMTHFATVRALGALLLAAGARRVRLVESTQSKAELEQTLVLAGWDVNALRALGPVEFENTRNLGHGPRYSNLRVPGGYVFSAFDCNHAYEDTDVVVSLAKLKNHLTAGVTLTMKNLFGITPNALYGDQAGREDATGGRGPLHSPRGFEQIKLPGIKADVTNADPTWRVPRIVADLCAARPVHLAILDGITAMSGGEGPWCGDAGPLKLTAPGVLIAGLNPVSTDAVGTAVMGYDNPRAPRGTKPFAICDNHLLLAEQAGTGIADLAQIEVRGLTVQQARCPYG